MGLLPGRNAKSGSMAKNATMKNTAWPQALERPWWVYFIWRERFDRLTEVVSLGLKKIEN